MDKNALPTPPLTAPPARQRLKEQIVQFEGFRCMAYLDESGKWRASFGGQELTGFISIPPSQG
jgi:hypothetical protein